MHPKGVLLLLRTGNTIAHRRQMSENRSLVATHQQKHQFVAETAAAAATVNDANATFPVKRWAHPRSSHIHSTHHVDFQQSWKRALASRIPQAIANLLCSWRKQKGKCEKGIS
ncbi:unnamed protein product [Toxocara canis]|uniref:Secreted protein n=1 Tax=Toxocara canis TaxID=6265 RepID=A0A183VB30_TOXCA|nr:unnamed protein product [Toxocara canis]